MDDDSFVNDSIWLMVVFYFYVPHNKHFYMQLQQNDIV